MKREIKFRAISHYSNQFEYGDLNLNPVHYDCQILINGVVAHSVKRETIGQFTGLKGENDIELYEGDIVGIASPVGVITYDHCGFVFDWIDKHYINNRKPLEPLFRNINLFKVFGNIHENNELLATI